MSHYLLFRSSDHLLLGVAWTGMDVAGEPPTLTAGPQARLVLAFPPQHVGEEISTEGMVAPLQLGSGAGTVPGWHSVLSGPSTVVVTPPPGAVVPLTTDGVLAALGEHPVVLDATEIELPWGLTLALAGDASLDHSSWVPEPGAARSVWRTRIAPADLSGSLPVRAIRARSDDPAFDLPLRAADRTRLVAESAVSPAMAQRIELSALGGTLDVTGRWPQFEWDHHVVLGRDMGVRLLARGWLYPFGHRAELLEVTLRVWDDAPDCVAALHTKVVLTVTEPVRSAPAEGPARRRFPFRSVELTTTSFTDVALPSWTSLTYDGAGSLSTYFQPQHLDPAGAPIEFPVSAQADAATVRFAVPLLFVADLSEQHIDTRRDAGAAAALLAAYGEQRVDLSAATPIDLTGGSVHAVRHRGRDSGGGGDVYEVHSLTVAGSSLAEVSAGDGFRPALAAMDVRLPELRALLDEDAHATHVVKYAEAYVQGVADDVMLAVKDAIPVDFTKAADRVGALVAPSFVADALSRKWGPVNLASLPNAEGAIADVAKLFGDDANILGFPMRKLLGSSSKAPKIVSDLLDGRAPQVTMEWKAVPLKADGGFVAAPDATFDLTVRAGPEESSIVARLNKFGLQFPPSDPVLRLTFETLTYTQSNGQPPALDVGHVDVAFTGDLSLVDELRKAVDLGSAAKLVDVTSSAIAVHYAYVAPPIPFGVFSMRDIAMSTRLTIPYDASPILLELGLSSRAKPFALSVLMFGGTGYAELELDNGGIRRIEAALEFGAMMSVDFLVAHGEVHVLGGIRFEVRPNGSVSVSGYLRMGGSVDVLGLISISIELVVELAYDSDSNALVGRATLVLQIDLTLWSDSVELDTGPWVLAGGTHHVNGSAFHAALPRFAAQPFAAQRGGGDTDAAEDDPGLAAWRRYQRCYAGGGAG